MYILQTLEKLNIYFLKVNYVKNLRNQLAKVSTSFLDIPNAQRNIDLSNVYMHSNNQKHMCS